MNLRASVAVDQQLQTVSLFVMKYERPRGFLWIQIERRKEKRQKKGKEKYNTGTKAKQVGMSDVSSEQECGDSVRVCVCVPVYIRIVRCVCWIVFCVVKTV